VSSEQDGPSLAEAVLRTITQPLLVLDTTLNVEAANPGFLRQFEVTSEQTLNRPVYELGNGQWNIPELRRLLEALLATGGHVENYRVEHVFDTLGKRVMLLNARLMGTPNAPDRILLAISDVTEREVLLSELEGKSEFADKLIDSVREGLLILHADLRVHSANGGFYDTFHVTPEETIGHLVYDLGNGQWNIPELRQLLNDILPRETTFDDYEVEHKFEGVGMRSMLLNGRRLDHLDLIILAIRDITEQRRAEVQQKTLTGELQHRVKNILNSVRALALQTRRRSATLEDFFQAFDARLFALARSQDLVVKSPLEQINLADLVRLELNAAGAEEGNTFTVQGPTVGLSPRDGQAMAMMVHELTTNATKYGALSVASGHIAIAWDVERRDGQLHLRFRWQEHGVRITDSEPAKGFGSRVIEKTLPYMLGGTSVLTFHPHGAECVLEIPLPD
jgi:two-component sensor histidine kinase/PAS domain-containing protein